jgi:hypothetical protein
MRVSVTQAAVGSQKYLPDIIKRSLLGSMPQQDQKDRQGDKNPSVVPPGQHAGYTVPK